MRWDVAGKFTENEIRKLIFRFYQFDLGYAEEFLENLQNENCRMKE